MASQIEVAGVNLWEDEEMWNDLKAEHGTMLWRSLIGEASSEDDQ